MNAVVSNNFRLLIGGNLEAGAASLDVINPSNEKIIAVAPAASREQLDRAVAAAKAAFASWSESEAAARQMALARIADAIESNQDRLARILTMEQGKPLSEAVTEVQGTAYFFRYFSTMMPPESKLIDEKTRRIEINRKPLGVVAAIIPWNFPLLLIAFKSPPALLAGNTTIIKPAPSTPLSTLYFGELIKDLVPPGVVNVISDSNDLGPLITAHPDIRKVSFTGSTETGRKVMKNAAATLKRLTLELGGNDPAIVLPDVDPEAAAEQIFQSAFANCGQVCLAIKRVYAHDQVYDRVCSALAAKAEASVVGDGLSPDTTIGPLQNRMQFDKVKQFLAKAKQDGRIIAGGGVREGAGFFIEPTIVRDIPDSAELVQEEQFGPLLPVVRYTDVEDVVRKVNASPYGLGASVWAADAKEGHRVAARIDAGTVWINKHLDLAPYVPFGGSKQSGIGVEVGEDGLKEFTQVQVVNG